MFFLFLFLFASSQPLHAFTFLDRLLTVYGLAAEEASALETHLKIVNLSKTDIVTTEVSEVDAFDWGLTGFNPQSNFQGVAIPAGRSHEEREDVNPWASNCPFTMRLVFSDGTEEKFRINQKFAVGQAEAHLKHVEGKRDVSYSRSGNRLTVTVR